MKKIVSVHEMRELLNSEKIFATEEGFVFNDFGKYRPDLTFVLEMTVELDAQGAKISPLAFFGDQKVTDSFNLEFGGVPEIVFGNFWRNQKGTNCFRPKDPAEAKHVLVRVDWGGPFRETRGYINDDAVEECGAAYFRSACSSGGRLGYDYWVLPIGYVRDYADETKPFRIDEALAKEYCQRHSARLAAERAEVDRVLRERQEAQASRGVGDGDESDAAR